ncbi:MAG: hypothetical protein EBX32_06260, partial [Burkholderiaceae bacterium]|nr:hypothetical protein [Burkholderiaceae bacterium]
VMGPAIGPCCYEVSGELVESFQNRLLRKPLTQLLNTGIVQGIVCART